MAGNGDFRTQRVPERLRLLPTQVPTLWKDWHFSPAMRRRVHARAALYVDPSLAAPFSASARAPANLGRERRTRTGSYAAVVAASLLLPLLIAFPRFFPGQPVPSSPTPPMGAQQVVLGQATPVHMALAELDGRGQREVVTVWRLRDPGGTEQLLALIWSRPLETGRWSLAGYRSLPGQLAFPLRVMASPGDRTQVVIISYQNADGSERHSLLVRVDTGGIRFLNLPGENP